jgi:8-oxo-dGTP pyrophosphatase MutT (NUDIX family)
MLRDFLRHWSPRVDSAGAPGQSAALPYRIIDGRLAVLLVTTRRSGKWIFPKGAIEPGLTPWDSAAKEALEEAGVTGTVEDAPIGTYRAMAGAEDGLPVDVDLFPLHVDRQLDSWKEQQQRLRHWATLREARRLLADPRLGQLAALLERRGIRR